MKRRTSSPPAFWMTEANRGVGAWETPPGAVVSPAPSFRRTKARCAGYTAEGKRRQKLCRQLKQNRVLTLSMRVVFRELKGSSDGLLSLVSERVEVERHERVVFVCCVVLMSEWS